MQNKSFWLLVYYYYNGYKKELKSKILLWALDGGEEEETTLRHEIDVAEKDDTENRILKAFSCQEAFSFQQRI